MEPEINCNNCLHYGSKYGLGRCKAFPSGIPILIASGDFTHDKPFDNDKGIRFTPIEDGKPAKRDSLNNGIAALRKIKPNV